MIEVKASIGCDKFTLDDVLFRVQTRLKSAGFDGFTAWPVTGFWKGERENAVVILVAVDLPHDADAVRGALLLAAKDSGQEAIYFGETSSQMAHIVLIKATTSQERR